MDLDGECCRCCTQTHRECAKQIAEPQRADAVFLRPDCINAMTPRRLQASLLRRSPMHRRHTHLYTILSLWRCCLILCSRYSKKLSLSHSLAEFICGQMQASDRENATSRKFRRRLSSAVKRENLKSDQAKVRQKLGALFFADAKMLLKHSFNNNNNNSLRAGRRNRSSAAAVHAKPMSTSTCCSHVAEPTMPDSVRLSTVNKSTCKINRSKTILDGAMDCQSDLGFC